MSMLQNAQFLRSAPFMSDTVSGAPRRSDRIIYVFVYSHYYDWSIFHRYFPTSNVVGTARLDGWTWHINANGQPNIRRAYISPSTTISQSLRLVAPFPADKITRIPAPCTYGYIFSLPSTVDRLIHSHFSPQNTRVRALFTVDACISTEPLRMARLNAITYFDPRHTSDLRRDIVLSRAQKSKWHAGLNLLRKTGAVPSKYAQRVAAKLNGAGEFEAVWVCPRAAKSRGMDLSFLAEGKVEDDVVIVDHLAPSIPHPPLNVSANQRTKPRLDSGTNISTNAVTNSGRLSTAKWTASPVSKTTPGGRIKAGATIIVDSGDSSQQSSLSPQKRARNPFARGDGDGDRLAKKTRRSSFGPGPRARRLQ